MQKRASVFTQTASPLGSVATEPNALAIADIARYAQDWYFDGEYRQHTHRTLSEKKFVLDKLLWFLEHKGCTQCGTSEIRRFLAYVNNGHLEPGGRWGNPHLTKPVKAARVRGYFIVLHAFFEWLVGEEILIASPMAKIARPIVRSPQVQPFTDEQIEALLAAAKHSSHPRRDEAIALFLLDTGIRATEFCNLRMRDIDPAGRRCVVLGKGNKQRTLYFGLATAKALWKYFAERPREPHEAVFLSDRGTHAGEPMSASGLQQIVRRLGKLAGIQAARCSPHTFRHTFACQFSQNGGNAFTLKELLGHTSLTMTNRYVALAQANMENQHRQFSPADRLSRNRRRS